MKYLFALFVMAWAPLLSASSLSGDIFNGEQQRFTAFRQYVYDKEWKILAANELPNGKYLFDVNFARNRSTHPVLDVKSGAVFNLRQVEKINSEVSSRGFDYQFDIPEINGTLLMSTDKNIFVSIYYDPKVDRIFETHYVQSAALICTALQ